MKVSGHEMASTDAVWAARGALGEREPSLPRRSACEHIGRCPPASPMTSAGRTRSRWRSPEPTARGNGTSTATRSSATSWATARCCSGTATPRWWRRCRSRRASSCTRAPATSSKSTGRSPSSLSCPRPSGCASPRAAPRRRLLALRLARATTGRPKIVKLAGHFHGWHDQVCLRDRSAVHGSRHRRPSPGLQADVVVVPADLEAVAGGARARATSPRSFSSPRARPGERCRCRPVSSPRCAALTLESGTVLIFDEVVSGFRWSPGGVQQVAGVQPDLTALGKILAGGMPGGAVCGRVELLGALALCLR